MTKPFAGFPALTEGTTLPNLFFSAVLPEVAAVEELVVSLYLFLCLRSQEGRAACYIVGRVIRRLDSNPNSWQLR